MDVVGRPIKEVLDEMFEYRPVPKCFLLSQDLYNRIKMHVPERPGHQPLDPRFPTMLGFCRINTGDFMELVLDKNLAGEQWLPYPVDDDNLKWKEQPEKRDPNAGLGTTRE